ncbi:MAG: Holliday junction branch migration protein RuvA [Chloroflexi bacterium]|nr:Holliday junction branch migration protein RuvA [Chloroflexota bacterium]
MIASLAGTLEARLPESAVVNVGGIGFKVHAPTQTLAALGAIGQQVRLLTLLYVRQDQLSLYGFATAEELRMFELLLTVSGIGPKVGIAILSSAPLDVLHVAIATGNAEPLTRIPGIGRKTAARLVLELKGKIAAGELAPDVSVATMEDAEILAALTSLGYTAGEAQLAIRAIPADTGTTVEERITAALRYFASR